MGPSDWIAIYGAVLASVLAVIQLADWIEKRRYLCVDFREILGESHPYLVITVDNRGHYPVTLDYVAFGLCRRSRWRFWRHDPINIVSVARLIDRECRQTEGTLDGKLLQPGEREFGLAGRHDVGYWLGVLDEQEKHTDYCIYIEHSQSDKPILKRFKWSK